MNDSFVDVLKRGITVPGSFVEVEAKRDRFVLQNKFFVSIERLTLISLRAALDCIVERVSKKSQRQELPFIWFLHMNSQAQKQVRQIVKI